MSDLMRTLEEYNDMIIKSLKGTVGDESAFAHSVAELDQQLKKIDVALKENFAEFAKTVSERDRSLNVSWDKFKAQIEKDAVSIVSKFVGGFTNAFQSTVSTVIERTSTSGVFGNLAGSLVGAIVGAFGGPGGMAIGNQIGGVIGQAIGGAMEGTRMTGATVAPYMAAGLNLEGTSAGGRSLKDYSAIGGEYLESLLEIREATGMEIGEADKLEKALARLGVAAASGESVKLAKLTSTYDQLFRMPSGTTLKMEETLIGQFGRSGLEVINVMGVAFDSLSRMNEEFKEHDSNIGKALSSGSYLSEMLGTITAQARTSGASLEGVEVTMLGIIEALAGVGNGKGNLGTPEQMMGAAKSLMTLLATATESHDIVGPGGAAGPALYRQLSGSLGGRQLIELALSEYSKKMGFEVKPGSTSAQQELPTALKQLQQSSTFGDEATKAQYVLDMKTRYDFARENMKRDPSLTPFTAVKMGYPGRERPDDDAANALIRSVQAMDLDKGKDISMKDAAKAFDKLPVADREKFTKALEKQADRADNMFSMADKAANLLSHISNWQGTYWGEWKKGLAEIMGGEGLYGGRGAEGVAKEAPHAAWSLARTIGKVGAAGLLGGPGAMAKAYESETSDTPISDFVSGYQRAPNWHESVKYFEPDGLTLDDGTSLSRNIQPPYSAEYYEKQDMEAERHHGINDGRR